MTAEVVETTAELAVVAIEEVVVLLEIVVVKVVAEDKLQFAISDFIELAANNKNLILIQIEENQKSTICNLK
jgi:hypothetical protein